MTFVGKRRRIQPAGTELLYVLKTFGMELTPAVGSEPALDAPAWGVDAVRVDRWLWAVRVYPTRSAATEACRAGRVRVGGVAAKPSTTVRVGHEVQATAGGRLRVLEVARVVERRVGAPVAAECVVDRSPPVEPADPWSPPPGFRRERGAGRPTKRERRELDRLRHR